MSSLSLSLSAIVSLPYPVIFRLFAKVGAFSMRCNVSRNTKWKTKILEIGAGQQQTIYEVTYCLHIARYSCPRVMCCLRTADSQRLTLRCELRVISLQSLMSFWCVVVQHPVFSHNRSLRMQTIGICIENLRYYRRQINVLMPFFFSSASKYQLQCIEKTLRRHWKSIFFLFFPFAHAKHESFSNKEAIYRILSGRKCTQIHSLRVCLRYCALKCSSVPNATNGNRKKIKIQWGVWMGSVGEKMPWRSSYHSASFDGLLIRASL